MKFAEIISAAGLDSNSYPKFAEIPIELFDRYNNEIEEFPKYDAPLFNERPDSLESFTTFLDNFMEDSEKIEVKIDKAFLGIYPSCRKPALFMRVK